MPYRETLVCGKRHTKRFHMTRKGYIAVQVVGIHVTCVQTTGVSDITVQVMTMMMSLARHTRTHTRTTYARTTYTYTYACANTYVRAYVHVNRHVFR